MQVVDPITEVSNHVSHALQLLEEEKEHELDDFLDSLHPVELLAIVNAVTIEEQERLISHITGLDQLSDLMSYANEQLREVVLKLINNARVAAIVRRLEIDDAADIVGSLPRRRQVNILKRLGVAQAKELQSLLAYNEETAGGIMTTLYLKLQGSTTAATAVELLQNRLRAEEIDPDTNISYIYVIDNLNKLQGACSLREVLSASPSQKLQDLMTTNIVTVSADDDQEKVARIIGDYGFTAIPVVSAKEGTMLGIITIDDVINVIEEEHTEDLLKLAGTEEEDTVGATVSVAIKSRIPWLIVSWLGGISGAMLLGNFSSTLEKVVSLAFFMPVVFGMGGNVGSQSSTITVRGIALGELARRKILQRLQKEVAVGAFLGVTFGCLLAAAAFVLFGDLRLCTIVGSSIAITMVCAASLGSMLPLFFTRLGFDPAVASGPLVTTTTDLLSITIYFSIASLLI